MEAWSGSHPLISKDEQSSLLTRIETESGSLFTPDAKLTAFVELERAGLYPRVD